MKLFESGSLQTSVKTLLRIFNVYTAITCMNSECKSDSLAALCGGLGKHIGDPDFLSQLPLDLPSVKPTT